MPSSRGLFAEGGLSSSRGEVDLDPAPAQAPPVSPTAPESAPASPNTTAADQAAPGGTSIRSSSRSEARLDDAPVVPTAADDSVIPADLTRSPTATSRASSTGHVADDQDGSATATDTEPDPGSDGEGQAPLSHGTGATPPRTDPGMDQAGGTDPGSDPGTDRVNRMSFSRLESVRSEMRSRRDLPKPTSLPGATDEDEDEDEDGDAQQQDDNAGGGGGGGAGEAAGGAAARWTRAAGPTGRSGGATAGGVPRRRPTEVLVRSVESFEEVDAEAEISRLRQSEEFAEERQKDPKFTLLHYVALLGRGTLEKAIRGGSSGEKHRFAQVARCLVTQHHTPVFVKDKYGCTPLQIAAALGNTDMVKALLEPYGIRPGGRRVLERTDHGYSYINHQDDQIQFSALHAAVSHAKYDAVVLLLKYGANPQVLDVTRSGAFDVKVALSIESLQSLLRLMVRNEDRIPRLVIVQLMAEMVAAQEEFRAAHMWGKAMTHVSFKSGDDSQRFESIVHEAMGTGRGVDVAVTIQRYFQKLYNHKLYGTILDYVALSIRGNHGRLTEVMVDILCDHCPDVLTAPRWHELLAPLVCAYPGLFHRVLFKLQDMRDEAVRGFVRCLIPARFEGSSSGSSERPGSAQPQPQLMLSQRTDTAGRGTTGSAASRTHAADRVKLLIYQQLVEGLKKVSYRVVKTFFEESDQRLLNDMAQFPIFADFVGIIANMSTAKAFEESDSCRELLLEFLRSLSGPTAGTLSLDSLLPPMSPFTVTTTAAAAAATPTGRPLGPERPGGRPSLVAWPEGPAQTNAPTSAAAAAADAATATEPQRGTGSEAPTSGPPTAAGLPPGSTASPTPATPTAVGEGRAGYPLTGRNVIQLVVSAGGAGGGGRLVEGTLRFAEGRALGSADGAGTGGGGSSSRGAVGVGGLSSRSGGGPGGGGGATSFGSSLVRLGFTAADHWTRRSLQTLNVRRVLAAAVGGGKADNVEAAVTSIVGWVGTNSRDGKAIFLAGVSADIVKELAARFPSACALLLNLVTRDMLEQLTTLQVSANVLYNREHVIKCSHVHNVFTWREAELRRLSEKEGYDEHVVDALVDYGVPFECVYKAAVEMGPGPEDCASPQHFAKLIEHRFSGPELKQLISNGIRLSKVISYIEECAKPLPQRVPADYKDKLDVPMAELIREMLRQKLSTRIIDVVLKEGRMFETTRYNNFRPGCTLRDTYPEPLFYPKYTHHFVQMLLIQWRRPVKKGRTSREPWAKEFIDTVFEPNDPLATKLKSAYDNKLTDTHVYIQGEAPAELQDPVQSAELRRQRAVQEHDQALAEWKVEHRRQQRHLRHLLSIFVSAPWLLHRWPIFGAAQLYLLGHSAALTAWQRLEDSLVRRGAGRPGHRVNPANKARLGTLDAAALVFPLLGFFHTGWGDMLNALVDADAPSAWYQYALVRALYSVHWTQFGRVMVLLSAAVQLQLALVFLAFFLLVLNHRTGTEHEDDHLLRSEAAIEAVMCTGVALSAFMLVERFKEARVPALASWVRLGRGLELCYHGLVWGVAILVWSGRADNLVPAMCGLTMLLFVARLTLFGLVTEKLSTAVLALMEILSDSRYFFLLIANVYAGFVLAVAGLREETDRDSRVYASRLFTVLLGDFPSSQLTDERRVWRYADISLVLLSIYGVIMLIIFMNLLIATMNDTYDRVKEFCEVEVMRLRSHMMVFVKDFMERSSVQGERQLEPLDGEVLHLLLRPEAVRSSRLLPLGGDSDPATEAAPWTGRITYMRASIVREVEATVRGQAEAQLAAIEQRLAQAEAGLVAAVAEQNAGLVHRLERLEAGAAALPAEQIAALSVQLERLSAGVAALLPPTRLSTAPSIRI